MERLEPILKQYWGYDSFRPLQREAMECVLSGHDSVVVLPTGGGKSLCYQVPALAMPGLAVVVSPLISLMKDQVDALRANGVNAAFLNSSLSPQERFEVECDVRNGSLTLLYAAPERLVTDGFLELLRQTPLAFIAVDEAHCISAWGHDFRPEYRELRKLREAFPEISIHGYTATATPHVREDIAEQLNLRDTSLLVGNFDRPNLSYRVQRRTDPLKQIAEIIDRHKGESGIVYCIRRSDVDDTCGALRAQGKKVTPYHAGMSDQDRKRSQEAFLRDDVDTVVATVAFGMGIDKSDVRYVIHAGMPKSLEHYQQETGRAGRDGLEAECTLLFSGADYRIWRNFLPDSDPEARRSGQQKLDDMINFCSGVTCRHRALVNYFGQPYDKDNCEACDLCLEEVDLVEDPGTITAKILSCVLRLKERFGADYTTSVLLGSQEARVFERKHNELTTYGILKEYTKKEIRDWLEQLVEQDFLEKTGEYSVLRVTNKGRLALHGEELPRLLQPAKRHVKETKAAHDSWEGVDRDLFETLRSLRRRLADEQKVPAYVVFGDAALRDMARKKPSNRDAFLHISGVGKKKCADYATVFLKAIAQHMQTNPGDTREVTEEEAEEIAARPAPRSRLGSRPIPKRFPQAAREDGEEYDAPEAKPVRVALRSAKDAAFALFAQGASLEDICRQTGRAAFTVGKYLEEYLEIEQRSSPEPWVAEAVFEKVLDAVQTAGTERLRTIYDSLQGEVSYDDIRLCLACLKNA
ncbi:MAG: DNA helicase RecQ [FCB group bacterium]|jgi:ATP-dependent DNA helicase RecQ|nr:DNA helicase RecQ [FCB group bacterium]